MTNQEIKRSLKLEVLIKQERYEIESSKLTMMPKGKIPGKELQFLKTQKAEADWQRSRKNFLEAL